MNQKSAQLMHPTSAPAAKMHRVEDIPFSDADTLPEFSNRDGSKETADKCWQLMMVRVPENLPDAQRKAMIETVSGELSGTWKLPSTAFGFCAAPHLPILHVAYEIAKKSVAEKEKDRIQIRSSPCFAEPKNGKFPIAKDSELKSLKFEVILGGYRVNWDKPETNQEVSKRVESTLSEIMRVMPNVILFLGPIVFDILFGTLEKDKRKSGGPKQCVVVENFRWKNNVWKRVQKGCGTSSVSAQLKPVL